MPEEKSVETIVTEYKTKGSGTQILDLETSEIIEMVM